MTDPGSGSEDPHPRIRIILSNLDPDPNFLPCQNQLKNNKTFHKKILHFLFQLSVISEVPGTGTCFIYSFLTPWILIQEVSPQAPIWIRIRNTAGDLCIYPYPRVSWTGSLSGPLGRWPGAVASPSHAPAPASSPTQHKKHKKIVGLIQNIKLSLNWFRSG